MPPTLPAPAITTAVFSIVIVAVVVEVRDVEEVLIWHFPLAARTRAEVAEVEGGNAILVPAAVVLVTALRPGYYAYSLCARWR